MVLILPCDWRFLPKLWPARRPAARAFFYYLSNPVMSRAFYHSLNLFRSFPVVTCAMHHGCLLRSAIRSHKKRVEHRRASHAIVT